MKDPYSVLGLRKDAKAQDIKSAFRKLAKRYHPDLYPNDKTAQERFAEINQAYEILGDKEKRAKYDRGEIDASGKPTFHSFHNHKGFSDHPFTDPFAGPFRSSANQDGFNFQRSSNFDTQDLFRDLFGRNFSDFNKFSSAMRHRGENIEANLALTLEQLVSGEKIAVTFPNGKKLNIRLPNYVEHGQILRLKGQGMNNAHGPAGDALVKLEIKKHPVFRLAGRDIHYDLLLPLKEAVLGTNREIATLDSRLNLKIPPWTASGQVFRLKERGLFLKNGKRADFYVHILIALPDESRAKLEQFVRENL